MRRTPWAEARNLLGAVALLAVLSPAHAGSPDESNIEVRVDVVGDVVKTAASFYVDVPLRDAWSVIADYAHAADFLSELQLSRVEQRHDDVLTVHQKGASKHGLFDYSFESLREVHLTPMRKAQSHLIRGTMRKLDTTTLLEPEGEGTRITDYRETIPGVHAPLSILRPFIESETRKNLAELRQEMLRRKEAGDGARTDDDKARG